MTVLCLLVAPGNALSRTALSRATRRASTALGAARVDECHHRVTNAEETANIV